MKAWGPMAIAAALVVTACSSDPPDAQKPTTSTTIATPSTTVTVSTSTSTSASASASTTASTTADASSTSVAPKPTFTAQITRTSYGIPHIVADDWGGLGFGQGYAFAQDRACTLIDQVIKVRGERAKWFGPGTANANVDSDFAYRQLALHDNADKRFGNQPPNVAQMVAGYVAGVNKELDVQGPSGWCKGQPWVQHITTTDLYAYLNDVLLFASSGNLIEPIATAQPPVAATTNTASSSPVSSNADGLSASPTLVDFKPDLASNGWAIGAGLSADGGGMLLANPHFPWEGEKRLWESQLTLTTGELDVYGASLSGVPGVLIGFNKDVAWTHTVSAGYRMTLYSLDLAPGDPTSYTYGTTTKQMTSKQISIDVKQSNGTVGTETRTMWSSHYGPMLNLPFGWTTDKAFTYRDANIDNSDVLTQFLGMDAAKSMDDFIDVHRTANGIPWVNTIATSADGRAWYADTAATPDLSKSAIAGWQAAVAGGGLAKTVLDNGAILLDGSDPGNEWVDDPTATRPGILPFAQQPQIERKDFVFNANDSHWLANSAQLLTGYSPLTGPEAVAQSSRTRENAMTLSDAAVRGADGKLSLTELQQAIFSNLGLHSQLLLASVLADCDARPTPVIKLDQTTYDVKPACAALHGWDGRDNVTSTGAPLWREFLYTYSSDDRQNAGALYSVPFDPKDPVGTPNTLNPDRVDVLTRLAKAAKELVDGGFAVDASLGSMQFDDRNGSANTPVPGGTYVDGTASVVGCCSGSKTLAPTGDPGTFSDTAFYSTKGYPVSDGDSFIMTLDFTSGGPHAEALLTYGQPDDPADPNFTAQTKLFAAGTFRPVLFTDAEIAGDVITKQTVMGD